MTKQLPFTPIYKIQGKEARSAFVEQIVLTRGVVTGIARRGFFIQDPDTTSRPPDDSRGCSHAVFVYMKGKKPLEGCYLEIEAKVVDYIKSDNDKPVTQLQMRDAKLLDRQGAEVETLWLSNTLLSDHQDNLPALLNSLEGMRVGIAAGATFVQPSNPFGDYVVSLDGCDPEQHYADAVSAKHGGIIFGTQGFHHWLPSFRMINLEEAPRLNVGAILKTAVTGPLYFRSGAYQLSVNHPIEISNESVSIENTRLSSLPNAITVMTLNCLNLDPKHESAQLVKNSVLDIDDDRASGQFRLLAQAIVSQAASPDIIALQEIQDNDGAEQTDVVSAEKTYRILIQSIKDSGGPEYAWADINPVLGRDGGQPGGNIRNGFLYNRKRVLLNKQSLRRIGESSEAFVGSRKPLIAVFEAVQNKQKLVVVNVHLASKRHQYSVFSSTRPGFDPREAIRIEQTLLIRDELLKLSQQSLDYYVTGDFNDLADSASILSLLGDEGANLVEMLPVNDRYDYNHRGKLHVLMHGIVNKQLVDEQRAEYEILHGNELIGIRPGQMSGKASDHAYVIARIAAK